MKKIESRYGQIEIIENDSIVCASLQMYGEWAQRELDILSRFIFPGNHVIDVGSFIGTHAQAFSSFVGPEGRVYAFEPRSELYEILSRNIEHGKCRNVNAFHEGLSDEKKTICVSAIDLTQRGNMGALSLLDAGKSETACCDCIQMNTIDNHGFQQVDFIKIDVEGMEHRVLIGAHETIQKNKPVIFSEVNSLAEGLPVLEHSRKIQYKVYACLTPAYNENNFRNEKKNIFDAAKELGFILIPEQKVSLFMKVLEMCHLEEISNADELALMFSHKPQYPVEVFNQSALSRRFHIFGYHYEKVSAILDETRRALSSLEQQYTDVKEECEGFQNQLMVTNSQIQNLQEMIACRDLAITERDIALSHKEQSLMEAAEAISQKDRLLEETAVSLSALQQKSADLEAGIAQKDRLLKETAVSLSELQKKAADLEAELTQKNQTLFEKDILLSEKEKAVCGYREELYSVYISRSWRWTLPVRKAGAVIRSILAIPHRPRFRSVIKKIYLRLPEIIRNSRLVEGCRQRFKSKETI